MLSPDYSRNMSVEDMEKLMEEIWDSLAPKGELGPMQVDCAGRITPDYDSQALTAEDYTEPNVKLSARFREDLRALGLDI